MNSKNLSRTIQISLGIVGSLSLIAILTSGCGPRGIANSHDVAGEYFFHYKTGEIEVLILHDDLTYRQEFYRDAASYQQHQIPTYTNSSTWSYTNKNMGAVVMNHWLMFNDWPNVAQVSTTPKHSSSLEGSWWPPADKRDAVILLAEDSPTDYALLRVKNRAEVK